MQKAISKDSDENFAIIFIPVLPGNSSGYQIAVNSALKLYGSVFDHIKIVAILPERIKNNPNSLSDYLKQYKKADFKLYTVKQGKKWARFLTSLLKTSPAIAEQFSSKLSGSYVTDELGNLSNSQTVTVIFEDLPLAYYLPIVKEVLPASRTIIRSHNVLGEAFSGFENQTGFLKRSAWKIENYKIKKFEKEILQMADYAFSISSRDAKQYERMYGIKIDGVIPVGIDAKEYGDVRKGDIKTIISLGSADLRKAHGINYFIEKVWPTVSKKNPESRLILGGKNTDKLSNQGAHVEGLGFVDDQFGFLSKGQIFINPQQVGSGVKLKSITAMLAGKTLVSTPKGVEGVEGEAGKDYMVAQSDREFVEIIDKLMNDPDSAFSIAQCGKNMAIHNYDTQHFLNNNTHTLKKIIGL